MGRATVLKARIIAPLVVLVIAAGIGGWAIVANSPSHKVQTVTNAQHQTTQLSYHGKNGINALILLKQHAAITTKHYSFGDMITSINGTNGNGPKYWTFYVNNKQASMGASSYVTKSSDLITWKLQ